MPNVENIKKAIAVMERVKVNEEKHGRKLLNMKYFQASPDKFSSIIKSTEERILHKDCGTVCCLAGWMAVSPEFQDQIEPNIYGAPQFKKFPWKGITPSTVIAELFGISKDHAYGLIHPYRAHVYYGGVEVWKITEEEVENITVDQVIEKLKELLV